MGWTGCFTDKSISEIAETEFLGTNQEWASRPCIRGGTYYRAVRNIDTGVVWCLVVLFKTRTLVCKELLWKAMDDTMGPAECNCPESILKILTPTNNETSNRWRERCYKQIEAKKREEEAVKDAEKKAEQIIKEAEKPDLRIVVFIDLSF